MAESTRDADVGGVQREGVVDAVAEERHAAAAAARWTRTMRAFCSGLTRANTVVPVSAAARRVVVEGVDSAPVSAPAGGQAEVVADLRGDRPGCRR